MVIGTLSFLPPPSRWLEVLEILKRIQGPVESDPSCTGFHIYEEHNEHPAIVLVEHWDSQAALDAHFGAEVFRDILGALELSASPPEVRFDLVSASEGMELIERARGGDCGPIRR
jgi:quinol monooxygenase YgiN